MKYFWLWVGLSIGIILVHLVPSPFHKYDIFDAVYFTGFGILATRIFQQEN